MNDESKTRDPAGYAPAALDGGAAVALTAEIVSAYVARNAVTAVDLPGLIASVHGALLGLGRPAPRITATAAPVPAVPVKKSVTDDYIVCLEDGQKFKSLKRHLQAAYGLTPDQYRAKWGLPADYPMAAATFSAARSARAKGMGLGSRRRVI